MTDPDEDKYCPSCGQEHDLDYDCEEDKMEEQRFINEIQELKATIEKLEGEIKRMEKGSQEFATTMGNIIASKHLRIEKLEGENGKLKTYIIELKSYISLTFEYLPKYLQDKIKAHEEQTEGK